MKLKDINPNPNNPRLIKDAKFKKLVNSIKDFPKMMELRPIVIDENNIVLGGNMRLKALKELKYKDIPDTWVKSAKDLTEEETRRFIIADNIGFGEHDWDILANEWDAKELEEWGLDGFPFEDVLEAEEDVYSTKIQSPIYETKEVKPLEKELYDLTKYNELINEIENKEITKNGKIFLKIAACRQIKFNYSKIADYYSHSDNDSKELIENSALVIIDYDKAIEKGFVELYNTIEDLSKINE